MLTTGAILHGDRRRLLSFDAAEHPVALQLGGGADERRNIHAYQLRDDGAAGGILIDGAKNVPLEARVAVDPKILREIKIRIAAAMNHAHERQIRHVLHGREDQRRAIGREMTC